MLNQMRTVRVTLSNIMWDDEVDGQSVDVQELPTEFAFEQVVDPDFQADLSEDTMDVDLLIADALNAASDKWAFCVVDCDANVAWAR